MSTYIQIPNSITTALTKKSKHHEAYTYALIKNQIKDNSRKASIAEAELATLIGETERTINTYISTLKSSGLLIQREQKQGSGLYPYNVYQFTELTDDYFVILPSFLNDTNLSPKLKGLLLFIKANCWKGTNFLFFNGKTTDLPARLGVGKNLLSSYLEELESKGYIRYIGNSLHIINDNFPLSMKENLWNTTYKIIYDYCLKHDRIPPVKNVDEKGKDKTLSWIVGEYQSECDPSDKEHRPYGRLIKALKTRCSTLPETVTLQYFCQVLCNKKPPMEEFQYSDIII